MNFRQSSFPETHLKSYFTEDKAVQQRRTRNCFHIFVYENYDNNRSITVRPFTLTKTKSFKVKNSFGSDNVYQTDPLRNCLTIFSFKNIFLLYLLSVNFSVKSVCWYGTELFHGVLLQLLIFINSVK